MIIHIQSATTDHATTARQDLADLTNGWGQELTDATTGTTTIPDSRSSADKAIDPVALVSLALSLPSAVLAVTDITDRIQKRRRAHQLIHHAQQLAQHNTTITLDTPHGQIELAHLDPDQLLDLWPTNEPPS
jgi:hypothetical protein